MTLITAICAVCYAATDWDADEKGSPRCTACWDHPEGRNRERARLRAEAVGAMAREGMGEAQIMAALGCSRRTVARLLSAHRRQRSSPFSADGEYGRSPVRSGASRLAGCDSAGVVSRSGRTAKEKALA